MQTFKFNTTSTHIYFNSNFSLLKKIIDVKQAVFITDENIFKHHSQKFKNCNCIVLKPGEAFKVQETVNSIIEQLIQFKANRTTCLIGVGGGVVTDITGFVASIYMRGITFGYVPTTVLGLVDASIGGKNGIDVGFYKNMLGVTKQPAFILHDYNFLKTLKNKEWQNGFAEIIKHACIKDVAMFKELQLHKITHYQKSKKALATLIERNVKQKIKVVQKDEFEKADRKLLNFGHTLGHALENQYQLSHGNAIAIGMVYATALSEQLLGFKQKEAVIKLVQQYQLPTTLNFDKKSVLDVLQMDKKATQTVINFILLEKIGKAIILPIPLNDFENLITNL